MRRGEKSLLTKLHVCVFVADPSRSTADRRQGRVWENLGGGAL